MQSADSLTHTLNEIETFGSPVDVQNFTRAEFWKWGNRSAVAFTICTALNSETMGGAAPYILVVGAIATIKTYSAARGQILGPRSIAATESRQQCIRDALGQPVDLFVRPGAEKETRNLSLRWYAYDQPRTADRNQRKRELTELADSCEVLKIKEVAVIPDVLAGTSDEQARLTRFRENGQITLWRDYANGKSTITRSSVVPEDDTRELLCLTPDNLREISRAIELESIECSQPEVATLLELLRKRLPAHPLVAAYDMHSEEVTLPQRLAEVAKQRIRLRIDGESSLQGVCDKFADSPLERYRVSTTTQIVGSQLHTMQYGQSLDDGTKTFNAPGETKTVLHHAGYADFESLWQQLSTSADYMSDDRFAMLAEIAMQELLLRGDDIVALSVAANENEALKSDEPVQTFFQKYAEHRIVFVSSELKKRRIGIAVVRILSSISLAIGGTVAVPKLQDSLQATVAQRKADQVAQGKMEEIDVPLILAEGAFRSLEGLHTAGERTMKLIFGGDKESSAPSLSQKWATMSQISTIFGDMPEGVEDEAMWHISAPNPEEVEGYWTKVVEPTMVLGKTLEGSLLPYDDITLRTSLGDQAWEMIMPQVYRALPPTSKIDRSKLVTVSGAVPPESGLLTHDGLAFSIPVRQGASVVAVEMKYIFKNGATQVVPTGAIQRPDGTTYVVSKGNSGSDDLSSVEISYALNTHRLPEYPVRARSPMEFVDERDAEYVDPNGELIARFIGPVAIDTQAVKAALGNPNLSSNPAEVAHYVQTHRAYDLTPFKNAPKQDKKSARGESYDEIFTNIGISAAKLYGLKCDTATLTTVLATNGGSLKHFVNPVEGFLNSGSPDLTVKEAHSFMIDNKGVIIEATPMAEAADNQILLWGLLGAGAAAGILVGRRQLPRNRRKRQALWLQPTNPRKLRQRHQQTSLLTAVHYSRPDAPTPRMAPPKDIQRELSARYHTLPQIDSGSLAAAISERRKAGWKIGPFTARALQRINKLAL